MSDNTDLQAQIDRLNKEKQALRQEFETLADPSNPQADTPTAIKREIVKLIPQALSQLSALIDHADSEATRAKLSCYVLNIGMGAIKTADDSDDSIKALIESLKPQATPTT